MKDSKGKIPSKFTTNSEVSEFIADLEYSARKILKKAHKQKLDASRLEQSQALRKSHEKTIPKTPKGLSHSGSVLMSSQNQGSSFSKTLSFSKETSFNMPSKTLDETNIMHYSVPKMIVSMASDTLNPYDSQLLRTLSAGTGAVQLSPIRIRSPNSTSKSKSVSLSDTQKRNKILDKIEASPFLSSSTSSVDVLLASTRKQTHAPNIIETEDPLRGTHGSLRMRATEILSGKQQSGASRIHMYQQKKGKDLQLQRLVEAQGPIDWSSIGLRAKYRGEVEREEAWSAWQRAYDCAMTAAEDADLILPVAVVERHPIYFLYHKYVDLENVRSQERSHARLRMKRFVFDVQEIWLTNLQHLREHQGNNININNTSNNNTTNTTVRAGEEEGHGDNDDNEEEVESTPPPSSRAGTGTGNGTPGSRPRNNHNHHHHHSTTTGRKGLEGRRDVRALTSMSYQIQSVSARRATQKAFHSTRMPEPSVTLDFIPSPTPTLQGGPSAPPSLHPLLAGYAIPVRPESEQQPVPDCLPALLFVDRMLYEDDSVRTPWRVTAVQQETAALSYMIIGEAIALKYVSANVQTFGTSSSGDNSGINNISGKSDVGTTGTVNNSGSSIVFQEEKTWSSPLPVSLTWLEEDFDTDVTVYLLREGNNNISSSNGISNDNNDNYNAINNTDTDTTGSGVVGVKIELQVLSHGFSLHRSFSLASISSLVKLPEISDFMRLFEGVDKEVHYTKLSTLLRFYVDRDHLWEPDDESAHGRLPKTFTVIGEWPLVPQQVQSDDVIKLSDEQGETVAIELARRIQIILVNKEGVGGRGIFEIRIDANTFSTDLLQGCVSGVGGDWEDRSDKVLPLSMRVSGGQDRMDRVPGACLIGSAQQSFNAAPYEDEEGKSQIINKELTQAAVLFFRDPRLSSSDSVLVSAVLALDSPCLLHTVVAWEPESQDPTRTPHEDTDDTVPMVVSQPTTLLHTPLENVLEYRLSSTASIFTALAEEGMDYMSLQLAHLPPGLARSWPLRDHHGFRRHISACLLGVDPILPTQVFGVTREGALPNSTAVNTRNVWHSTFVLTDPVNRPRVACDMHYVIQNDDTHGSNDPASFTVRLRDGMFFALECSGLKDQSSEHTEIYIRRAMFAKQLAMEMKIENAEVMLRAKDKEMEVMIRKRAQRAIERKLNKATRMEKGWARRMALSTLSEVQGHWERRRDDRTGMFFFHNNEISNRGGVRERYSETCQWVVPSSWDGDPLADGSASLYQDPSFVQPVETWLPRDGERGKDDTTPGVVPRGAHRAKKGDADDDDDDNPWDGVVGGVVSSGSRNNNSNNTTTTTQPQQQLSMITTLPKGRGGTGDDSGDSGVEKGRIERALLRRLAGRDRDDYEDDVLEEAPDSDDDLWSDDEQEAGDLGEGAAKHLVGDLPQTHKDVAKMKSKMNEGLLASKTSTTTGKKASSSESTWNGVHVPILDIEGKILTDGDGDGEVYDDGTGTGTGGGGMKGVKGTGWRRLPRPEVPPKFFHHLTKTHTMGPDGRNSNMSNSPLFLAPISPVDACEYEPPVVEIPVEVIFISDVRSDVERVIATYDRQVKLEEALAQPLSTAELLQQTLSGVDQSAEIAKRILNQTRKQDDRKAHSIEKAILAAKSSDVVQLEDALEEDISVDTADQFGNTLLILAAQQGSKRVCKFLLRRGANINSQNRAGNTCLHYCWAYSHKELGLYLKNKVWTKTIPYYTRSSSSDSSNDLDIP
eukprot:gene3402-6754_t